MTIIKILFGIILALLLISFLHPTLIQAIGISTACGLLIAFLPGDE